MKKIIGIFNKDSILPSILKLELELMEQENEELRIAEEKVQKAKFAGEKLIKNTIKELPRIEEEERKKIFEEVTVKVNKLKSTDEKKIRELELNIKRNKKLALDCILKRLIPQWNGRYNE